MLHILPIWAVLCIFLHCGSKDQGWLCPTFNSIVWRSTRECRIVGNENENQLQNYCFHPRASMPGLLTRWPATHTNALASVNAIGFFTQKLSVDKEECHCPGAELIPGMSGYVGVLFHGAPRTRLSLLTAQRSSSRSIILNFAHDITSPNKSCP